MAIATAPNGNEKSIRVIVFRETDHYVAQCLDYDIATQAKTLEGLVDRLELTLDAEFAICEEDGMQPNKAIPAAPNYYHELWDSRFMTLDRINLPKPDGGARHFEMALAKAA
jgi:hypothetical protein